MKNSALFMGLSGLIISFDGCSQKAEPAPPARTKSALNLRLKHELDSILVVDQRLRQMLFDKGNVQQRDSVIQAHQLTKSNTDWGLNKLLNQTDSVNLVRVEAIISQYGYPGKSLVGTPTNESAFYVIQHSSRIPQYLPLIEQAARQGELPFVRYAMMLDRKLMNEEKPQVYGTQGYGVKVAGSSDFTLFIWPIQDPGHVNERRQKAGFPDTVEAYAKDRMGVEYRVLTVDGVRRMPGYQPFK